MNQHFPAPLSGTSEDLPRVAAAGRSAPAPAGNSTAAPCLAAVLRKSPLARLLTHGMALLTAVLPIMLSCQPAQAQIIADPNAPKAQQAVILPAANGVPQVNIQSPSAAGVSRNTYSQFDVQAQGAILNNSRTNVQTQLGGWVQANPYMAGGTARVVLNEVNSSNPSNLRGYVEVAGDRAQVVIANPAGVSCDGCGFINANRVTLTSGSPIMNGGSLDGYAVRGGSVSVQGKGMDASQADYTDIIARAVQLNAGVWAKELRVSTGVNQVNAEHTQITAGDAASGSGPAPAVAIDVAQLGGMYANKIVLIGTEAGVGMRNAGALLASGGDLVLQDNGWLSNSGNLQASANLQIASQDDFSNSGRAYAGGDHTVTVAGQFGNSGTLGAQGNTTISASAVSSTGGSVLAGGMAADGSLSGTGKLSISARQSVSANGHNLAAGDLSISAASVDLAGSQSGGANIALSAASGDVSTAGATVVTAGTLSVSTGSGQQSLNNSQGSLSAGQLALNVANLNNRQGQIAQTGSGDVTITLSSATGVFDNSGGSIAANSANLNLNAATLDNGGGKIKHAGNGTLTIDAGTLSNTQGQIASAQAASLQLDSLRNDGGSLYAGAALQLNSSIVNGSGVIAALGDVTLTAASLSSGTGSLLGAGVAADGSLTGSASLSISASQSLSANGQNLASGNLGLSGASIDIANSQTGAANVTLAAAGGDVNTSGASVVTPGTLSISTASDNGQSLNNTRGSLNAGQLALSVANLNNQHGQIVQTGNGSTSGTSIALTSASGTLDNSNGTIAVSGSSLSLSAASLNNASGTLQYTGSGDLSVTASTLGNQGGVIVQTGTGATTVTVAQALDNSSGVIAGNGSATYQAGSLNNDAGQISAGGSLGVTLGSGALSSRLGTIAANDDVTLHAASVDNTRGTIASVSGSLAIVTTGSTVNDGGILQAAQDLRLTNHGLSNSLVAGAAALSATSYGSISGATLAIDSNGQTLNNAGGTLAASQSATLQSGVFNNAAGLLQSGGDLSITSASLTNTNAASYLSSNSQLNGQGGIVAQGALTLATGGWINDAGYLGSRSSVTASATSLSNAGGQIQALGDLAISTSGTLDNRSGLIRTNATATLDAASLDNSNTGNTSTTSGLGIEGQNIDISAATVVNDNGAMRASSRLSLTSSGSFSNQSAWLSAGDTLTLQDSAAASSRTLAINNTGGTMIASRLLSVAASSLTGAGQVLSQTDLSLAVNGDLSNSGQVIANGDATISAGGNFSNTGKISAGGTLDLSAANIDNAASGELAGSQTYLRTSGTLTNRGLIDGSDTRIDAATVNNIGSGRIYGDTLSIAATTLINNTETVNGVTQAAVIAARDRLDLGISGSLVNREHALIYAGGDMAIGGSLDSSRRASGQAGSVNNNSATIEAGGALAITSAVLNNTNEHLGYQVVPNASTSVREYVQPNGSTIAGSDVAFVLNYPGPGYNMGDGHLILASSGITADQVKYAAGPANALTTSICSNDNCTQDYANYSIDDPVWAYFNITPPRSAQRVCTALNNDGCSATAWEPAWASLQSKLDALHTTISAATVTFLVWRDYTETTYQAQVTSTDPARIASGGAMTLRAGSQLLNANSQIVAGGALNIIGAAVNNQALQVSLDTVRSGSSHDYVITGEDCGGWFSGCSDIWEQRSYAYNASVPTTVNLSVAQSVGNTAVASSTSGAANRIITSAAMTTSTGSAGAASSRNGAILEFPVAVADASGNRVPVSTGSGTLASSAALATAGSIVVRTSNQPIQLPASSLFQTNPSPTASYLIATDPRFTNSQQWLSSDYMTQALSLDPSVTQKRLGDGYYEQQLIRDQVAQLTGRRFLDNYTSDAQQYQALMDNAVTFAQQTNLQPGIALTAEQVAQLTSDIVWLVQQSVTLADGSTQQVLVPQLYVRTRPGDLDSSGSLLTGSDINLQLAGDLSNSGQIAGRQVVQLNAANVSNLGSISGNSVGITAQQDISNTGGSISAVDSLTAVAGRDLNVSSTVQGVDTGAVQLQMVDRVAGLYVTGSSGTLQVAAGRDVNLGAAVIANSGTGNTIVAAGRDLNLASIQTVDSVNATADAQNYLRYGRQSEAGTQISGGGAVQLAAANDVNARAATVQATGALSVSAGNDLNISAGQDSQGLAIGYHAEGSGFLSSASVTSRTSIFSTQALASDFGGDTVQLQAGHDLTLLGSNVVGDNGASLSAQNNLNILAAVNTTTQSSFKEEQKSGFLSSGGIGITYGSQMHSLDQEVTGTSVAASMVGSTQGNVTLSAGQTYQQTASDVMAPAGDVSISAKQINIVSAAETSSSKTDEHFEQSGLTLALSGPAISALQGVQQMAQAAGKTKSARMKALAAASGALSVVNGIAAQAAANAQGSSGISLSITVGGTRSDSETLQQSSMQRGSQVAAGGNVILSAAGDSQTSDINVIGSSIKAGQQTLLSAEHDINLLGAENVDEQSSSHSSLSYGAGLSIDLKSSGGAAFGFTANAAGSRGNSDGRDVAQTLTQVSGGQQVTLISGNDTTLKSAVVSGNQVSAIVGNDLNIISGQDTSTYGGKERSLSGSVTAGAGFSGSVSGSMSNVSADFASVSQQSGIEAGDGGFNVVVKGNTDLQGGKISSTQAAVDGNLNSLTTGSLTTSSIENRSQYKAESISLGVGGSGGGIGAGTDGGVGYSAGSEHSTTQSSISGGAITINDAAQQAKTGQSAEQVVASLDRSALTGKDGSNSLIKNWDGQELQADVTAQAQIMQAFGQQAAKAIGDYATNKVLDLNKQIEAETDPDKKAALQDEVAKWAEGGTYRVALHTLAGALGGGVGGALGAGLSAATIPEIGTAIKSMGLPEELQNSLIAIAGTAVGALAGGGAGAVAGLNQTANNFLKHADAEAMAKEVAACQAKSGGCKDDEVVSIVNKYKAISDENMAVVQSCIKAGDVQCVQDNLKQAATTSEVKVLPFGYTRLEDTFIGRQDNVNSYGSVNGSASLFGTDVAQAAEVAKFRQDNCSGISSGACDSLVKQAMDYRLVRMATLTAAGIGTAVAVNTVKGLSLPGKVSGASSTSGDVGSVLKLGETQVVNGVSMTRVGRWMSPDELKAMQAQGSVVQGAGGQTYISINGAADFKGVAAPGSVYVEFDAPANSLLQGGKDGWLKMIGPDASKSQQYLLNKQNGTFLPQVTNVKVIDSK